LRTTRQLVLERLLCLDCDAQAPLQDVTQAMTDLAEFALQTACNQVQADLQAVHGRPLSAQGEPVPLWVVGMGKLGARELNVSSDIDLIYVYDQDGETGGDAQGRGRLSNQEYFGRAVRALYGLIGDTTEHGFVFRVDLALRPNGNSGPPAVSLGALEEYLHVQGREWERFAWLKSRVVATLGDVPGSNVLGLRSVVLPFVFRRYLDYGVFDALRVLHRQIREHALRRSTGHPERANDVKLSRGGIREIEFTVQLLQVVRGGQFPELRTRPTLSALPRLAKAGLMPQATAQALAEAYVFLRQVEHRIQYLDDQQTHVLPTQDHDLGCIASWWRRNLTSCWAAALSVNAKAVAARRAPARLNSTSCWRSCRPTFGRGWHIGGIIQGSWRCGRNPAPDWCGWWRAPPNGWARVAPPKRRQCDWPTGWSHCCGAKATWHCCWSGPMCMSDCCACWAQRAGQHATCYCTPA
jgi:glutamate-ammonia-ligase adenylyltransferase